MKLLKADILKKIYLDSEPLIEKQLDEWRNNGFSIVFTNGCFDLIHYGHISYLAQASQKADKLVIGLNSNVSIKKIKGDDRPILDEKSRSALLAALGFTDMVILSKAATPIKLIELIKPDVLVKGADYKAKNIVGYDFVKSYNGLVDTIKFEKGYATSSIIQKICQRNKDGS